MKNICATLCESFPGRQDTHLFVSVPWPIIHKILVKWESNLGNQGICQGYLQELGWFKCCCIPRKTTSAWVMTHECCRLGALQLRASPPGHLTGQTALSSEAVHYLHKLEEGPCESWFSSPGLVRLFTYWISGTPSVRQCFCSEELLHSTPLMTFSFPPPSFLRYSQP